MVDPEPIIEGYRCGKCNKKHPNQYDATDCCKEKEIDYGSLTEFELKKEHLVLLKETNISWNGNEFGAPMIDSKRPYGNSGGVNDVAEILGFEKTKERVDFDKDEAKEYDDMKEYLEEAEWSDKSYDYLERVHKETQVALEIVLQCQTFKPGKYRRVEDADTGAETWILV